MAQINQQKKTGQTRNVTASYAAPKNGSVLQINLLGSLDIRLGTQSLADLGSKKALALFCYLSLTPKSVARDVLTMLFWPEMNEKAAKNNLRSTLTLLRKHLGPYLVITTANVAFDRRLPYQLDVELLYNTMEPAITTQDLAALQAAVAHYRGEFLHGFHLHNVNLFEEWLLQQREQLHLLVLRALETLLKRAIEQHAYQIGLDAGHKIVAMEPWAETAHRQLMLIFAMMGQRGRALQQYKICCRLLGDELGVEPMAETTALYRQIQAGQFGQANSTDLHTPTASPHAASDVTQWPVNRPPTPPKATGDVAAPAAVPHNLQKPLAKLIGRQTELTYLVDHLTRSDCRLLTVFGPGGVGKSSLCLALGQRLLNKADPPFPDGIFFIPLAGFESDRSVTSQVAEGRHRNSASLIITAIAESIGCQFQDGRPLQTALIDYLQQHRLLLILDNFEQFVEDADVVIDLLTRAPTVTMLVTSRTRLNIRGETTLMLSGLSLPPSLDGAARTAHQGSDAGVGQMSEAVALFVDCAQNLDPTFTLDAETIGPVTQICQAVAGLPLAIEMTAAWVSIYSCAEIAERLMGGQQAELLISQFQDQPARHQNLQKVFADSWRLLPRQIQWALARASLFSGQFTHAAAQAVADLTLADLMHLRDHSLLQVHEGYSYSLHPLIRQFAAEKWQELTQQQPDAHACLRNAHSHYYLQRVAALGKDPKGEVEFSLIHTIKKDHAEIVRGWLWAVQQRHQLQIQRTMDGLFRYLELTSQSSEGNLLFGAANVEEDAPLAPPMLPPILHWLQVAQCHFMRRLANYDAARRQLKTLLPLLSRMMNDRDGEIEGAEGEANKELSGGQDKTLARRTYTFAQCVLGWINYEQGEYESAQSCFADARQEAERITDLMQLMEAHNGLGAVAFSKKEYALACTHYETALTHAHQQADLHYTAIILGNLAAHAQVAGTFVEAEGYLQMRLEIDRKTQNRRQMAISYQRLGQLALIRDAYTNAETHLYRSLDLFRQLGNSPEIPHILLDISQSLLRQRRIKEAEAHCLQSLQLAMQAQLTPRILTALTLLAEIRMAEEKNDDAITLLQMVNRNAQIPVATWRSAQKLQETLIAACGENNVMPIRQTLIGQSLLEFGTHLLMQGRALTIPGDLPNHPSSR